MRPGAQGTGQVWIGGQQAQVQSWTGTLITATVPTGATTGSVEVIQSGNASNAVPFTLLTGPAAFDNPLQPGNRTDGYGGSLGLDFDVTNAINISSMGVFDPSASVGQPLQNDLTVAIYDRNSQQQVPGTLTVFHAGTTQPLIDGDIFQQLTAPVTLQPGQYSVVSWGWGLYTPNGNRGWPNWVDPTINTDNGAITAMGSRWGDPATFPANPDGGNSVDYMAGTFLYNVVPPPPSIASLSATNGPIGTTITITGTGFGTTPQTIMIGNVPLTIVSWTDDTIEATVPSNAITGYIWFQSGQQIVSGDRFIITGRSQTPTITLSPSAVSLVVGDTRTLDALDPDGNPFLGLAWSTSDPTIVSLSTDDPPVLTALSPGQATITAANATATVTVYAGPDLPDGTIKWSAPGDGSGVQQIIPAVPSPYGVADVFAIQQSGTVQAVTSDGHVAWTTAIDPSAVVVADFQGGMLVKDSLSITKHDGKTGLPLFTYSTSLPYAYSPVAHTDGTVAFVETDPSAGTDPNSAMPNGYLLTGIDPKTGAPKFHIKLKSGTYQNSETCITGSEGSGITPPIPSQPIIAGDGYIYLLYSYGSYSSTLCDRLNGYGNPAAQTVHSETYYQLLRISTDGTYSDIPLHNDIVDSSYTNTVTVTGSPLNYWWISSVQAQSTADHSYGMPLLYQNQVLTNADQGVIVVFTSKSSPAYNYSSTYPGDGTVATTGTPPSSAVYSASVMTVTGGQVIGESTLALTPAQITAITANSATITPVLQQADDTFVGTLGVSWPPIPASIFNFDTNGNVNWSQTLGGRGNIQPLYALADGSTVYREIDWPSNTTQKVTVDATGQELARIADDGDHFSWTNADYEVPASNTAEVSVAPMPMATGFMSSSVNPSGNQTSVGVSSTNELLVPVWALAKWDAKCQLGNGKVQLLGDALQQYNDTKQKLLNGNYLKSDSCSAFFNDPARAAYFNPLPDAVQRQQPFNGPESILSEYDAGMWETGDDNTIRIQKQTPVCGIFRAYKNVRHETVAPNGRSTAASQIQPPGTDVYIDPTELSDFTQGTIVHEALHNLTGKYDTEPGKRPGPDLETLLGLTGADCGQATVCITNKLVEAGCAGTN